MPNILLKLSVTKLQAMVRIVGYIQKQHVIFSTRKMENDVSEHGTLFPPLQFYTEYIRTRFLIITTTQQIKSDYNAFYTITT